MTHGDPPTELSRKITDFDLLCTERTRNLMDAYAKEDYQQAKRTRRPVTPGSSKGKQRPVRA